ncbi:MAG: DUF6132 family protein [Bacteroidetes bacterium]|nr:DUF6132 family protein [Bacteroidota bacterium]MCL5739173.1 DUF6132 family protein [Bacteroidota bacterium]
MDIKKLTGRKNLTKVLFVVVGAIAGYAYYHFIGCATGTCPITGNPYVSTMYGGLMGFTLGMVKED